LVYSTCSAAKKQNEDIVRWLLDREADAELLPLPATPQGSPKTLPRLFDARTHELRKGRLFVAHVCAHRIMHHALLDLDDLLRAHTLSGLEPMPFSHGMDGRPKA
jgi:hypothetical protein